MSSYLVEEADEIFHFRLQTNGYAAVQSCVVPDETANLCLKLGPKRKSLKTQRLSQSSIWRLKPNLSRALDLTVLVVSGLVRNAKQSTELILDEIGSAKNVAQIVREKMQLLI